MSYFPPNFNITTREPSAGTSREPSPASTTRGLVSGTSRPGTYPVPPVPPIPAHLQASSSTRVTPTPPKPVIRPTRPIMPGRISSWDSLDDRVRTPHATFEPVHAPNVEMDTFERLQDGRYRRVGSISEPTVTVPEHDLTVHVPRHRIGWRTVVQIYGVLVAMSTACIAAYNLYARTHSKPGFSTNG